MDGKTFIIKTKILWYEWHLLLLITVPACVANLVNYFFNKKPWCCQRWPGLLWM